MHPVSMMRRIKRTPAPADQMMQHDKAQATQPNLQPEEISQKIGLPELFEIDKGPANGNQQTDRGDEDAGAL